MPENTLYVEIVTPYGMFYAGQVEMVVVTCKDGEIGILPGHTSLVAALVPGEVRIKVDGEWHYALATNGYAEIGSELTIIVVSAAEWPDQIDTARAERALARAEARLKDPSTTPQEFNRSTHSVQRARARLKVAAQHASDS